MPQPLVALQTVLPQLADPGDLQLKAYKLRDLAAQANAADLARADEQATRAAYAANPTDGAARLSALAAVSPKAYAAEAKAQSDQAKATAETQAKQLETAHKHLDLAGQAFGYVRNNPTLENANSAISWLTDNGVFSPEMADQYRAQVQANPSNIKALADQAFTSTLATKDQLPKFETRDTGGNVQTLSTDPVTGTAKVVNTVAKTQSPDNIATNQRIAAEGAANRAQQERASLRVDARERSKGEDDDSGLSDATKARIAQQFVDAGDASGLQNVGRGAQGARDLRGIQNAITDYAAKKGLTPTEISAKLADYKGQTAGIRSASQISAKIENAAAEAAQLAPLAIEAGRNVSRSGFLPFGRAQVMFNNQTNDENMNRFATANIGLATAYAGAMARGGKATVTDNEHARELLSTAKSQQAYEAIVGQMQQEIEAARRAPNEVRRNLRGEISGKGGHGTTTVPNPVAAPALPSGWSVEVH